jgi:hypothetical protein
MMVARTLEIDNAVRRAQTPQVVILGAGLGGRAWRMAELASRSAALGSVELALNVAQAAQLAPQKAHPPTAEHGERHQR